MNMNHDCELVPLKFTFFPKEIWLWGYHAVCVSLWAWQIYHI